MKKIAFLAAFSVSLAVISSCKKDKGTDVVTEPIMLIAPTSTANTLPWRGVLPIQVKYATDQVIDVVQTLYQIDTSGSLNVYTYPDTLICSNISGNRTNIYTWSGNYTVPDSLPNGTQIRFNTSFFTQGKYYEKQFKIIVQH